MKVNASLYHTPPASTSPLLRAHPYTGPPFSENSWVFKAPEHVISWCEGVEFFFFWGGGQKSFEGPKGGGAKMFQTPKGGGVKKVRTLIDFPKKS